jgi:predicted regulator of Ras-like GTPase activity (Roadblock/LC7/MglB family)
MDDALIALLDYKGVLTALATTPDGLVIAAAGLGGDDAEILGAAGATLISDQQFEESRYGSIDVEDGTIHVLRGDELSLVVLSEQQVPNDPLSAVMQTSFESVESAFL